jgi:large subunit ribosomal protein L35
MPKLKTNSSAKKRFKITASGKVKGTQAGKKHNMRKRSKDQLRNLRGTVMFNEVECVRARAYFPYAGSRKKAKEHNKLEDQNG